MKRVLSGLGVLVAIGVSATPLFAGPSQVTICHATSSATNPYVVIHPAAAGVVRGHLDHHHAADIVPPFTHKGVSYSQNWDDAGRAIHANGCAAPTSPTPPTDGGDGGGSF